MTPVTRLADLRARTGEGVLSDGRLLHQRTAQRTALSDTGSRAQIANLVTGVTNGFEKKLEITGVGYQVLRLSR